VHSVPHEEAVPALRDLALAGVVILITLATSTGVLLNANKIDQWRDKRAAERGRITAPTTPQARVIPEVFRDFGAPPSENPECVANVLAGYYPTLKWNGFSWVDSSDPAPGQLGDGDRVAGA
jgi:hypothetical protein